MSFGPVEAIVIVVVVLVVFGAGRLSGVGKALGTGLREFRQEARAGKDEDSDADTDTDTSVASTSESSSEDKS